jgi:hypothetical protein
VLVPEHELVIGRVIDDDLPPLCQPGHGLGAGGVRRLRQIVRADLE